MFWNFGNDATSVTFTVCCRVTSATFLPFPDLVVTKITPLRPWSPYNTVAAKPFRTFIVSILFGSKSKKRLGVTAAPPVENPEPLLVDELNGTPSTTNSGCVLPLRELYPLMLIFVPEPEVPPVGVMLTPGILPCRIRATSCCGRAAS